LLFYSVGLFVSACAMLDRIYSFLHFIISPSFLIILFFNFNHSQINSTMMTWTRPVGSCHTRSATIPTFAGSWNFTTGIRSSSERMLPSLGRSCWTSTLPTSNGSPDYLHTMTQTTTSILQPITGPSTVDSLPLRAQRKPSPTTCHIVQYHGAITRAILLAPVQSMTSSRRSRSLKHVVKAAHHTPSEPSVPMNFEKAFNFFGSNLPLNASTSIQWSVFGSIP